MYVCVGMHVCICNYLHRYLYVPIVFLHNHKHYNSHYIRIIERLDFLSLRSQHPNSNPCSKMPDFHPKVDIRTYVGCMHVRVYVVQACLSICMYLCMRLCMPACMCACVHAHTHVCCMVHVRMSCMYVCLCMHACMCITIRTLNWCVYACMHTCLYAILFLTNQMQVTPPKKQTSTR